MLVQTAYILRYSEKHNTQCTYTDTQRQDELNRRTTI